LFTSPHLVAVRERIRINGAPISEALFAKYSQDVWERLEATKEEALAEIEASNKDAKAALRNTREHPDKPIYFRYLTLVALHAFIQEKVDCAILEVGVGGEYDSTNIIEKPIVCGITALGLDHVSVLGNTIDQIAWHKAGIIKVMFQLYVCVSVNADTILYIYSQMYLLYHLNSLQLPLK
jgi:folylpolyglutamate synthase